MTRKEYALFVGAATAACSAAGALINRKRPVIGCFVGAAAGFLTASVAAEALRRKTEADADVLLYSRSSPLYENAEDYQLVQ